MISRKKSIVKLQISVFGELAQGLDTSPMRLNIDLMSAAGALGKECELIVFEILALAKFKNHVLRALNYTSFKMSHQMLDERHS